MSYAVIDYYVECFNSKMHYLDPINSECPSLFKIYPELVRAWMECVNENEIYLVEQGISMHDYDSKFCKEISDDMSMEEMDRMEFEFFQEGHPECDFTWNEYFEYRALKDGKAYDLDKFHGAYCEEIKDKQESENARLRELEARLGVCVAT